MGQRTELQIDDDEAPQLAMEEQQINPIPRLVDAKPPLPPDKGEAIAKFEQKILQPSNQGLFRSDSEYSSLRSRNSSTYGSLIASAAVTASAGVGTAPLTSIAALFFDSAVRS